MAEKTTEESGGTRDPEEIEQEIEQTREELGDTVAAVTDKADVKKQAKAKVSGQRRRRPKRKTRRSRRRPTRHSRPKPRRRR